jgi:hypothetical protein
MPNLILKIQYNKNRGTLFSATELMELYLYGIPVCTLDGDKMPLSTIQHQIEVSQKKVEVLFSIKFDKQVIEESQNFIREEFNKWGYVRAMYPVDYIAYLKGYINSACQLNYPMEWLSLKKTESTAVYRNIHLIPNSASEEGANMTQNSLIYNGITPYMGWFGQDYIPNYWRFKYVTGWDPYEMPQDLLDMVGRLTSINVLSIIGGFLYGAGVSSLNVSLDGVSQTIPLTKGGKYGIFGDRIQLYLDEINASMDSMRENYRGLVFEVL